MDKAKKSFIDRGHFVFPMFFVSATLILLVSTVVYIFISRMEEAVLKSTQNHLIASARAASTYLTVEELSLFHTNEDMEKPEWESLRAKLQQFA